MTFKQNWTPETIKRILKEFTAKSSRFSFLCERSAKFDTLWRNSKFRASIVKLAKNFLNTDINLKRDYTTDVKGLLVGELLFRSQHNTMHDTHRYAVRVKFLEFELARLTKKEKRVVYAIYTKKPRKSFLRLLLAMTMPGGICSGTILTDHKEQTLKDILL